MSGFDWKIGIRFNMYMLRFLGLWPDNANGYKTDLYAFYSFIVINLFATGHNFFQTANVYFVYNDIETLSAIVFITTTDLLALMKIFFFVKNIKLLKKLISNSSHQIMKPKNSFQVVLIEKSLFMWKIVSLMFWIPVGITLCLWAIYPLWDGSFKNYRLPFIAWYPFNTKASPTYEITYIYQVLSIWFLAIANVNMDTLIAALMMFVGAQCDIISDDIRKMKFANASDFTRKFLMLLHHHRSIIRCVYK